MMMKSENSEQIRCRRNVLQHNYGHMYNKSTANAILHEEMLRNAS
jgi:hypothetical protein